MECSLDGELQVEKIHDSVWDVVLRNLYHDLTVGTELADEACSTVSALARTCRCMRDVVRRVRAQTTYRLYEYGPSGSESAEHLNRLSACSAVRIVMVSEHVLPSDLLMPPLLAFLAHISDDTRLRVQQLCLCFDTPGEATRTATITDHVLDSSVVLKAARALPVLTTLTVHACVSGPDDLFAGLADCCPSLRELKVHVPNFQPKTVGSLSKLHLLTSLELCEELPDWHDTLTGGDYPDHLLHQLAALTALTHLSIAFERQQQEAAPGTLTISRMAPTLAHLPLLRSLELTGSCSLAMDDFPALAAALPSLERLRCSRLLGHASGLPAAGEALAWRMPRLEVIEMVPDALLPHARLAIKAPAQAALDLAARCPALRRLGPVRLGHSASGSALGGAHLQQLDLQASEQGLQVMDQDLLFWKKELLDWEQALDTLAARGVLAEAALEPSSEKNAGAMCAALEQLLQPGAGQRCTHLMESICCLRACSLRHEGTMKQLAACLPHLRDVHCFLGVLPALAPLRHLSTVHMQSGSYISNRALVAFAELREEALRAPLEAAGAADAHAMSRPVLVHAPHVRREALPGACGGVRFKRC